MSFTDFFKNLFTPSTPVQTIHLNDKLKEYRGRINKIVNDILEPYLNPNEKNKGILNLVELLDPKKCNDYAIYLSEQLETNFNKLELEQFNEEIYVDKKSTKICSNDIDCVDAVRKVNIRGKSGSYSKKQLCDAIASHYIKMFNLIASILSAVNPNDNMCLHRMRKLYSTVSKETNTRIIKL